MSNQSNTPVKPGNATPAATPAKVNPVETGTRPAPTVPLNATQLAAREAALKASTTPVETKPNDAGKVTTPVTTTPVETKPQGEATPGNDAGGDATAAHVAAMAQANANAGKGQGGTAGGKRSNVKTVAAAKPAKQGKAAAAMADTARVFGYDLSKFGKFTASDGAPLNAPSKVDIAAAMALGAQPVGPTANALSVAAYLSADGHRANIYDWGMLIARVMGQHYSGDHKANASIKLEGQGLITIDRSKSLPYANGANLGRNRKVYVNKPTKHGLAVIRKHFEALGGAAAGFEIPERYLPEKPVQASKPALASQVPAGK